MTKIVDFLAAGPSHSFEFFPPKTPVAERQLEETLRELEALHPTFVSVTYGAGGTTREMTHDIVTRINRETSLTAMAHLTCAAPRPRTSTCRPATSTTRAISSTSCAASATSRSASRCTPKVIPRRPNAR